jgi:hypothetical protein
MVELSVNVVKFHVHRSLLMLQLSDLVRIAIRVHLWICDLERITATMPVRTANRQKSISFTFQHLRHSSLLMVEEWVVSPLHHDLSPWVVICRLPPWFECPAARPRETVQQLLQDSIGYQALQYTYTHAPLSEHSRFFTKHDSVHVISEENHHAFGQCNRPSELRGEAEDQKSMPDATKIRGSRGVHVFSKAIFHVLVQAYSHWRVEQRFRREVFDEFLKSGHNSVGLDGVVQLSGEKVCHLRYYGAGVELSGTTHALVDTWKPFLQPTRTGVEDYIGSECYCGSTVHGSTVSFLIQRSIRWAILIMCWEEVMVVQKGTVFRSTGLLTPLYGKIC